MIGLSNDCRPFDVLIVDEKENNGIFRISKDFKPQKEF
jgi:hypothetical protein